jgi:hypothetical protein
MGGINTLLEFVNHHTQTKDGGATAIITGKCRVEWSSHAAIRMAEASKPPAIYQS